MVRYGFTWHLQTLSGGGVDSNNDPVAQTETWTPFICDAQLASAGSGFFTVGGSGDKILIAYVVWVAPGQGLTFQKGANVRDHNGTTRIILENEYNYFSV